MWAIQAREHAVRQGWGGVVSRAKRRERSNEGGKMEVTQSHLGTKVCLAVAPEFQSKVLRYHSSPMTHPDDNKHRPVISSTPEA